MCERVAAFGGTPHFSCSHGSCTFMSEHLSMTIAIIFLCSESHKDSFILLFIASIRALVNRNSIRDNTENKDN